MFGKWLQQDGASWNQLLEALRSPSVQLMHLASKIEQMLDDEHANYHHNGKEIIMGNAE